MKEEELIEKLKNAKLPDIELESHKSRLKMALLDAGYPQKQRGAAFWELAKYKLKGVQDTMLRGLISRQPVWKTVTFGALAIAVMLGLSLTIPSLTADSAYAQAEEIAQNSPELQAAFGEDEFEVVTVVQVVDGKGTIIAQGGMGIVSANVDLDAETVTEVIVLVELTDEERQKAIDIVMADPRIQELLDSGASIGPISTMYSSGSSMNVETGEVESFSEALVTVNITGTDTMYVAQIDLDQGKLIRLIETSFDFGEVPGDMEDPGEPDFYFEKDPLADGETFDTGETS